MTTAIFEILALLTVSCLIGIFFTYRYWKAKYQALLDSTSLASKEAETSLQNEREQHQQLRAQLEKRSDKTNHKNTSPTAEPNTETQELQRQLELRDELLGEKERELKLLSTELSNRKISYYKQINGKRYKAITLKMADESIAGKGDGRISTEDANKIFDTISDGKAYTQVEKDTMRYLRENYNWTDSADELFRKKVRSWAAKGHDLH